MKIIDPKAVELPENELPNEGLDFSIPLKKTTKMGKPFEKWKLYIDNASGYYKVKEVDIVNFKSSIVKFSRLFSRRTLFQQLLMLMLLALGMSVVTLFLIQNSGLYSAGISGIFQGIARLSQVAMIKSGLDLSLTNAIYNAMFWGTNLLVNIPLVIFAYKKIAHQFAYLTMVYIIFNQLFGFALTFIPGIENIFIFGATVSDFTSSTPESQKLLDIIHLKLTIWKDLGAFCLLIYTIACGLITGLQFSILYIIGSSSGGADIISFYFAKKKNKSIGSMLAIFNTICIVVSVTLGSFIALAMIDGNLIAKDASTALQMFLSPNLLFSIMLTLIVSAEVNYLFPKSKFIQIKVYTKDAASLKNNLSNIGYKHDIYINQMINSTLDETIFTLETICMYIELPEVLSTLRAIDSASLISINRLSDVDGQMYIIK